MFGSLAFGSLAFGSLACGSLARLGRSAVLVLGLAAATGCSDVTPARPEGGTGWYAGYVDVTLPSAYEIDKPPVPAAANTVLSFIVADGEDPCAPSWGGYHSLDQAQSRLDLDGRIARLREAGGEVAVSFGGASGAELATACSDEDRLAEAYRSVIDRYQVDTIDLDLEGEGLEDEAAGARRASVIARLQGERGAGDPLHVWLTLPAEPPGLTAAAVPAVARMLGAGVELAGVNIMTMNYGGSKDAGTSTLDASVAAAQATHRQLGELYAQAGRPVDAQALWARIGLTPMIGHNDVEDEVAGLDTAQGLNAFARSHGIGRLSMWSLNRDRACSKKVRQPSNTCSGVGQAPGQFSSILGAGYTGRIG